MTLRSPLRRATLICLLLVAGTYLSRDIAAGLGGWLQKGFVRICVTDGRTVSRALLCRAGVEQDNSYRLALVLVLVAMLVAALFALRWAVRPIRELATQIRALGPQNFAYRLRAGSRHGEMAALADAVNDMISRVAVGYESQRRFAADASHELRTPLAVQRTLIEVGLARAPGPEKLRVLTEQLLETNERNVRLIEALLVLSESDRGLASRSELALDAIVGAVVGEHRNRAAQAGVTITAHLTPRPVIGEQVLLERLVTNLLQNAIKYNRPGGTITVTVGHHPALVVENTGDDVPAETVAGLFEPFRRLNGVRIDHSGGVGLGLTIARSIVHAHDGTISGHSTGRDGLRIEVVLPAVGGPAGDR
ncbi:HAMP domain-containing sensor histidine kinase [Actinoplanes sp. DH11]|uniref:HAMP domain-containing sensor histidine kinase n=1 Tax=Actinoplanes sp. DH11 TaxID=2857011 RepID=UPI001E4DCA33|nr:HAMP domain-containing sensor histidine kinase [Actinoplanes sp. DH11]